MNYYKKQIFPLYYYHTNISETRELKKKFISPIVDDYGTSSPPSGWETTKLHTSFSRKDLNEKVFGEEGKDFPTELYMSYIDKFFDLPWEGEILDIWYNCYIDGDYQERHNHNNETGPMNPHFSCIHYLSFDPERHQPVTFFDPLSIIRSSSQEFKSNNYKSRITPRIREGDFLMFPSFLEHSVRASEKTEDYPRVTIAFNLFLYRYGEMA